LPILRVVTFVIFASGGLNRGNDRPVTTTTCSSAKAGVDLRDLLALGAHYAHRWRPARRRLRPRLNRQQGERKSEQEA
jgi:hypothetical protein